MSILSQWWSGFAKRGPAHGRQAAAERSVADNEPTLDLDELIRTRQNSTLQRMSSKSHPALEATSYHEPVPLLPPEIEAAVEAKVKEQIGEGGYLGYCHQFWGRKKEILREEYGIDWKTPAEMNPGWLFD